MRLTTLLFLTVALVHPAAAQTRDQTLADVRQELTALYGQVRTLSQELSSSGGSIGGAQLPTSVIDRVNAIESELQRLTAKTEELEFRVDRIVSDGTNRIGDLEFRLCELEDGCDIGALGETPTLGGGSAPVAPEIAVAPDVGPQMALGEQADFDRAQAALDAGQHAEAVALFAGFAETYPAGPLTAPAHLGRGEALSASGDPKTAARAYLDAFSFDPDGAQAPKALLLLGESLGALGQTSEACVTFGEVQTRWPESPIVTEAEAARGKLDCP